VHGTFPSFLASWAAMTATMLLMAVPAAARYAHGRIADGKVHRGTVDGRSRQSDLNGRAVGDR